MAATPRPPRRRPSSVQPGARPRRVAGRTPPPGRDPSDAPDATGAPDAPDAPEAGRDAPPPSSAAPEESGPPPWPAGAVAGPDAQPDTQPGPSRAGLLASRATTLALAAVIVVLALASLGGGAFLLLREEPAPSAAGGGSTAPDDSDLLTISPADARSLAQQAGQATYDLVARSWQEYDAQVEAATALLTPEFAEEFRATTDDAKPDFVRNRTEVQVSVVSQGVVSADDTQAQVLVFLNSLSTKDGEDAVYTPFRALVTMERTDDGWLVADLETA